MSEHLTTSQDEISSVSNTPINATAKTQKGKGAKHRDAAKFRAKKNDKTDKELQKKFDAIKVGDVSVETLFGQVKYTEVKPPIRINVDTEYVLEIVDALIPVLTYACKVPPSAGPINDLLLLKIITALQIEAKAWFATSGTQFAHYEPEMEARAKRTRAVLPTAIFPISHYLEQIGKFEFDHQMIYPRITGFSYENIRANETILGRVALPENTFEIPEGNQLTGTRQWMQVVSLPEAIEREIIIAGPHGPIVNPAFLVNPNGFMYLGLIRLEPPGEQLPEFTSLVNSYNDFIGRISRRVNNAFVDIDFNQARGTCAQMVNSWPLSEHIHQVTCLRSIPTDSLVLGGLLGFGFRNEPYNEAYRCVETTIEVAGSTSRYVRNVTSRLR